MTLRGIESQCKYRMYPELISEGVVFEADFGDFEFGNRYHGTVEGPQIQGTDSDVFDGSYDSIDLAEVAYAHCAAHDDGEAAEQVCQRFLRCQCECYAAYAEAGYHSGDIHSGMGKQRDDQNNPDENFEQPSEQTDKGGALHLHPHPVSMARETDEHVGDANQQPCSAYPGQNHTSVFQ